MHVLATAFSDRLTRGSGAHELWCGGFLTARGRWRPSSWVSLLIISSQFAVKDLRHFPCMRRRTRITDFAGERGRDNGHVPSDVGVSPGHTYSYTSYTSTWPSRTWPCDSNWRSVSNPSDARSCDHAIASFGCGFRGLGRTGAPRWRSCSPKQSPEFSPRWSNWT